jgi:hypothetical protein
MTLNHVYSIARESPEIVETNRIAALKALEAVDYQ